MPSTAMLFLVPGYAIRLISQHASTMAKPGRDVGMKLCLDTHWIYRGAGNSNVALFDILKLYGDRVVSLHLRQSVGGVWSETLFRTSTVLPCSNRRPNGV